MMKKLLLLLAMASMSVGVSAQRFTDKLDRGIVGVPARDGGYLVSWRKFGEEYYDTQYNLYRNGTKIAGPLDVSNYVDPSGSAAASYQVEPVVRGVAKEKSAAVYGWTTNYFDVLMKPVVNRAGKTIANSVAGNSGGTDTTTPGYTINDVSLADVTGDGITEFIVKRNNNQGNLNSSGNTTDFNLYECYKIDGTRLWWIDLGPNLMAGPDEQWDMIGYDWDMDGKAEMVMRAADNMIIHTKSGKTINIGDMSYYAPRDEYTHHGKEYLLYINGETGEPYGWDGTSDNFTPMAFPLPRFEVGEAADVDNATSTEYAKIWGKADTGHRSLKIYMGAPYLDGVKPSMFFARGCYTRHKMCALDVNPMTHELTQRWRWNCYDGKSPWFGNGFHNFQIADVDLDGRDEIMFGSMTIDDTGFGLATTGLGHGDAQHCGDLDPYRWGLEQFTCLEGSEGNSYWNATTGELYYRKSDGGDDGRSLAGNFSNNIPGGQGRSVSSGVIGLSTDKVIVTNGDEMSGNYANLNNRIFWDDDLLDEIFNSKNGANRPGNIFKWGGVQIAQFDAITNNWTKCNPSAQGDILGDWREELVLRLADNTALRIYATNYSTQYPIYTLWHDHEYRNAMAWQCVGYNQPPHPSFFLGELEGITMAPPPLMERGRVKVANGGSIGTTDNHLLICDDEDLTINVQDGASPYIVTDVANCWVQGSGSKQATAATPKSPARTYIYYTHTLTGGAFTGATRVVKQGEGTLVLPKVTEKYTGNTDVWNGTLRFDGTMESSPVWLNRHTTLISNGGQFLGGLKADYNATIYPGGKDNVGSVTVSDLSLGFGSRIVFDVNGTNVDNVNASKIIIEKKTWENGPHYRTPVFEFRGAATLPNGKYLLGNVGSVEGNLKDILIEGIQNGRYLLELEDGKLYLIMEYMREANSVVWNGTESESTWDRAMTKNFLRDGEADYAAVNDTITFNDNAAVTNVVVEGAVAPGRMIIDNNVKDYSFSGDSILGTPDFIKNGTRTVTLTNENRIKSTIINGGKVVVKALANNSGTRYGALGNVSSTVTLNDGAILSNTMPIITDQRFYVNGNVTIDVPSSMTFTFNKGLLGTNAVVTKTSAGSLTLGTSNTFRKIIAKGGRVNSVLLSNIDQLPDTVQFEGGVVWGANMEDGSGVTNNATFVVEKLKTGTFYGSYRGLYRGKLLGEGTFNVYSGGVRAYWEGDWSEFKGTVNVNKHLRQNKPSDDPTFDFRNTYGLPNATLNVTAGLTVNNQGKDFPIGKLTGTGTLAGTGSYILGGNGDNFYLNTNISAPVIKRGAGKMTMITLGKLTGKLTVEEGTVTFNNAAFSTPVTGTSAVYIKDKGRIVGQGKMAALYIQDGGELVPCASYTNETTPGEIRSTAMTTVSEGGTITYLFNATKQSLFTPVALSMNGTVKVILLNGYTPAEGDEFTLWNASVSYAGTPKFDLPVLPDGLAWDTSQAAQKKSVLKVVAATGISTISSDAFVDCEVYTLSGSLVGRFASVKAKAALDVMNQPLGAGTYIVKMKNQNKTEIIKVMKR